LRDEILEECPDAETLRDAFFDFILHRFVQPIKTRAGSLVGMSVGRFGNDSSEAWIDEPLVFMNLARWINSSQKHGVKSRILGSGIAATLRVAPPHHLEFGRLTVFYLWTMFAGGESSLSSIFSFDGEAPPWANQPVQLVQVDKPRHPAPDLLRVADSNADVMDWFADPIPQCSFLLGNVDFGADVVFQLWLPDGALMLVCLQFGTPLHPSSIGPDKLFPNDRRRRKALTTLILQRFSPLELVKSTQLRWSPRVHHFAKYGVLWVICSANARDLPHRLDFPLARFELPLTGITIGHQAVIDTLKRL